MTQTVQPSTQESTMHIPYSVLGIILDTSNIKQQDVLKSLTQAFLRLIPHPEYVSTFLIATSDGVAYPINVTAETFARQWQEFPWGKKSDVTAGLTAMQTVMREYTKPHAPTPNFRTLLLTASPPADWTAFQTALQMLGRVEIGVLGEGETQRQTHAAYRGAIGYELSVTLSFVEQGTDLALTADYLFRSLE